MSSRRFALCIIDEGDNILSKAVLTAKWSEQLKENLSVCHGINAQDCINNVVVEELKKSITPEVLTKLVSETEETSEARNWQPGKGFTNEGSCNCTRLDS